MGNLDTVNILYETKQRGLLHLLDSRKESSSGISLWFSAHVECVQYGHEI